MLELSDSRIDLWYLDQSSQSVLNADLIQDYVASFSKQESLRYERLQISAKREQFLLGKVFLRQVLSHYHPIAPLDWKFCENEHGKPGLDTNFLSAAGVSSPFAFNLSHSRNLFVVAVSAADRIGVDVEYSARSRLIVELAKRHFSSLEIAELQALTGKQQLARFYRVWTLKEAYVKARGVGLTVPLQDFSLHFKTDSQLEFTQQQPAEIPANEWQFVSLGMRSAQPAEPYTVSVAVGSTLHKRNIRVFEFMGSEAEQQLEQKVEQKVEPEVFAST